MARYAANLLSLTFTLAAPALAGPAAAQQASAGMGAFAPTLAPVAGGGLIWLTVLGLGSLLLLVMRNSRKG